MKLAAYEKRDLKATKRVRFRVGMAMLAIAAWVTFWVFPPVGWYGDAPWTGSGPALWDGFSASYSAVLAEWPNVIPTYTHALAGVTTLWRIPIATAMVFEFYIRVAGCLLASLAAWFTASRIMVRAADGTEVTQTDEAQYDKKVMRVRVGS